MSYKTDGSSHNNGVKGEKKVLEFFNNKENYNFICESLNKIEKTKKKYLEFNFVSKGGTQNREDLFCVSNNISISVKSKKIENSRYKGTFDLINTASIDEFIGENCTLKSSVESWRNWNNDIKNSNLSYKYITNEVNSFYNKILNSITGKEIKNIFEKIKKMENNAIEVIRDYRKSIDENIKNEDIHFLERNWFYKEFSNNVDMEQKIYTTKNSSYIKTKYNENSPFRLRVVLNNGVSALMRALNIEEKIPGKNNTSILTLKVQVDKVKEIVEKYDVNLIK